MPHRDLLNNLRVPQNEMAKFAAAFHATSLIENDMKIGLGTGSTAFWFVVLLARKVQMEGLKLVCTTTSSQTQQLASIYELPLISLDEMLRPDIVIDGADEVDKNLNLIKGGGGALLQEKIVASAADRMVVIADEGKYVNQLGKFHLPVEIVRFGWRATRNHLRELFQTEGMGNVELEVRKRGLEPFISDEGHYIIDCYLKNIPDAESLDRDLNAIPGVVENGLFINMADGVILGTDSGEVRYIDRDQDEEQRVSPSLPIDLIIENGDS